MKPLENGVTVVLATQVDDALVQAFGRLLPQLSKTALPLSAATWTRSSGRRAITCS